MMPRIRKTAHPSRPAAWAWLALAALLLPWPAYALDTLCARVKIEIKQELTLERQAFDAEMKINNGLDTTALDNVEINVNFSDEAGNAVKATTDPTDSSAKFFIRIDRMDGISDISGNGSVAPASTADIHWLIIPAPGSGGTVPSGKLYLVGATLKYTLGGEARAVDVTPDSIYVKPLPLLTLDYFLTQDVYADDPLTAAIEPPVPFTLGVRIKNNGAASAKHVKIDSAQPKIVDNQQGLLINFKIIGSYVNDQPASDSLLIPFGDIAPQKAATGRWIMVTTLSGKFVDFSATFTHADALGGAVTSILQATHAHLLVRDVKVDLPGRDNVRDFLAQDGDVLRVYESDSGDTAVSDQSAQSSLVAAGADNYVLNAPATAGFMYVSLPDPANGGKVMGRVVRADGKVLAAENAWFSKSRNPDKSWNYRVNFFDANTPGGAYQVALGNPAAGARPPVLQFIADKVVKEGEQLSFVVQASDPDGAALKLSAAPLPTGAHFVDQGAGTGYLDWTPAVGQAGQYSITYTASDGSLEASASARITVEPATRPGGPDIPVIQAPQVGTEVRVLQPILLVASPNPLDTAVSYQFEVYGDAALSQAVASNLAVAKAGESTTWKVVRPLNDNSRYYWRVRSFDGSAYSQWANGRFFVNTANDPPGPVSIASPASGGQVATLTPTLAVANSVDPDREAVSYAFRLYSDAALTQAVAAASGLQAGAHGATAWTVPVALSDNTRYYWRVSASDPHGAQTQSVVANFLVDTANRAPTAPVIAAPLPGSTVTDTSVTLRVANSTDADNDPLGYTFELDRVDTFNSPDKRGSGPVAQGTDTTGWSVADLAENTRYYWRAKASDGKTDSAWVMGEFFVNSVNDPPTVPVLKNPGNGAWSDTLQPKLEVGPASDPEGDAVSYRFQIYSDAGLSALVGERLIGNPEWLVTPPLSDNQVYYWRVRAVDSLGAASNWSGTGAFTVATGTLAKPSITLTAPAKIETRSGPTYTITWEARDPQNDASIDLYDNSVNSGPGGQLIVKGLKQDPNASGGSYAWNVGALPPGTYYVYGVIYNSKASDTRYAPGAVVVPLPNPKGSVSVQSTSVPSTTEGGGSATFQVALDSAPTADVTIGLSSSDRAEGRVSPASLTFTPSDWNVPQEATVTGVNDCVVDGNVRYRIVPAKAVSLDPNYNGVKGTDLDYLNYDNDFAANASPLVICNRTLVSTRAATRIEYDITFQAQLTNTGPDVSGVSATLSSSSPHTLVIDGSLSFGPVNAGQTVTSQDTFTVRHDRRYPFDPSVLSWDIQPKP